MFRLHYDIIFDIIGKKSLCIVIVFAWHMQELLQLTDGTSETNQLIIDKKFTMQEKTLSKYFSIL